MLMLEYIMSINFVSPEFRKRMKRTEKQKKMILELTKLFFVLGLLFLFLSFAPSVWYLMTSRVDNFSLAILETVNGKNEPISEIKTDPIADWQPAFNQKLSRETLLKIPEIKVDTTINERTMEDYETALKLGVWRVPDFGTPVDRSKPMILAAHRFGFLEWSNTYRRKNSFYNLPKLKNGDVVEIIYKQRKYIYEIYGESRGDEIVDYSANLILYTCETLNSKVRIFKYGRLLQI